MCAPAQMVSATLKLSSARKMRRRRGHRSKSGLARAPHVAPSQSITVAQAATEWLAHCEARGLEQATTTRYAVHVHKHIVPRIGRLKLTGLTVPVVASFEDQMLREGVSPVLCRKVEPRCVRFSVRQCGGEKSNRTWRRTTVA